MSEKILIILYQHENNLCKKNIKERICKWRTKKTTEKLNIQKWY